MIKNASKTANLIAACFLLMACGGDEGTEDTMDPAGQNSSGGASAGTSSGSTGTASTGNASGGSTSGTSTGSTGTNGAGTSGGSGNGTTGTTGGAAGGDDGGVDPGSSSTGGTSGTSGTGGSTGSGDVPSTPGNDSSESVQCGTMVADCNLKTKSCCGTGIFPAITFTCSDGTSCAQGSRAVCDGPEDCSNGQLCCVSIIKAGEVSCTADACGGSELCHTDDDCSTAGARCERGTTFPAWGICK